jgi:predicted  nucleic acid-binding Zn-ribbon protein
MAPETIRLVSETSASSPVRTKIEILFAALDSLKKARDGRADKYRNDTREKIDLAARELQTTADAARVVQKQKDLENLKNQFEADTAAFDFMTDKIDKRLEDLGYSCPSEMIEVLEKRLDRLQKIVDQADTTEKNLSDEIRALKEKKRRLENRIKAGQVPPITQLPEPTPEPQVQRAAQARRPSRRRR